MRHIFNMKHFFFIYFLFVLNLTGIAETDQNNAFSSYERAKQHPIVCNKPAVDFFEGALLGNGGLGIVVTTRPDGVMLYFGHNNVWDIRIAENNREKIGTFSDVFEKVKSIPDTLNWLTQNPWYREYNNMAGENYRKSYPRPFPCGSVLLGFDRRKIELTGHRLDISNGMCEIFFLTKDLKKLTLQLFTDMYIDKLWMRLVDEQENLCENIFNRVRVMPDPSTPKEFPKCQTIENLANGTLSFRQVLPSQEPEKYDMEKENPKDKAFRLTVQLNSGLEKKSWINWNGNEEQMANLECAIPTKGNFIAEVLLEEGLNTAVGKELLLCDKPGSDSFTASKVRSSQLWKVYWNKSGVQFSDEFLERTWYQNLYFFNCAVKEGVKTPGLFANWSYNNIGTAWHGDYHMNYNTQQPFWLCFSSNHLEKNLSYVSLIEFLMDVSRKWAKEYYNLPGAYFPHSAFPVDMTMNPYPLPDWGWEVCETPWAVQGLWWHYLYSKDVEYLRNRAYEPIKAAVEFLVAYMKRPDTKGERWKDNRYHIFPTIPPELYGLRPGFKYNYDGAMDLALVKFIFKAFEEASTVLGKNNNEQLLVDVKEILSHFPEYPTASSSEFGTVLTSVPGEHSQAVYNVPANLAAVFPGEDLGLHSDKKTLELAVNSYLNQQNEGGNDLVFCNMQAVRIGMLDLEKFKRQINYCLLPNGTASDRVLQVHGRYGDTTDYGYMDGMGIWFENFALPAVINECLMQSYQGTIRLFPNWPMNKNAHFSDLRAAGAFLVSATLKDGKVNKIKVVSEAGSPLKIILPWANGGVMKTIKGTNELHNANVEIKTGKGEIIEFLP